MEYEERISPRQGNYIVASSKEFEEVLIKEPLQLPTGDINPGDYTTLHDWFVIPIRFCGFLPDTSLKETKKAIFHLGEGTDSLFVPAGEYYDMTFVFSPNNIGKTYKEGTFRDCYLRKVNDKYTWK